MENNEKIQEVCDDKSSNFFKLDMPIGRLKFFVNTFLIFILQAVLIVLYLFISIKLKNNFKYHLVTLFCFFVPIYYLYFITFAKRLWDFFGSKKLGLIGSIVVQLVILISYFQNAIWLIVVILLLVLYLKRGKLINKKK